MKKVLVLLVSVFFISSGFVDMMNDCTSDGMTYYSIEDALKEPDKVKVLDISMGKLKAVPAGVEKLVNLECLDLSFNNISTLPESFKELKNLKYLNLAGTRFMADVPAVVYEIPSLKILDIQDHPEWKKEKFNAAVAKLPNVRVITTNESSGPVELK